MSISKHKRELARWETATRQWAADAGRSLALNIHHDQPVPVRPYTVGLVLWEGEQPWVEVPVTCSADIAVPVGSGRSVFRIGPWLITSQRVAGRLQPDILRWWTWDQLIGVQVNLTPGRERVCLDLDESKPVYFDGPGVAPLAVAAVYRLHGPMAVIEHPGLAPLRAVAASVRVSAPGRHDDQATRELHAGDGRPET
jgi:hypothetical protein